MKAYANYSPKPYRAAFLAAMTRATGSYTFDAHINGAEGSVKEIVFDLRDYIMSLDEAVEESPKKFYVAYKVSQNFVCMEVKKNKVILYLKLDASEVKNMPANARDVWDIGHYGTGDFELSVRTQEEAEAAREYIKMSFERVGG